MLVIHCRPPIAIGLIMIQILWGRQSLTSSARNVNTWCQFITWRLQLVWSKNVPYRWYSYIGTYPSYYNYKIGYLYVYFNQYLDLRVMTIWKIFLTRIKTLSVAVVVIFSKVVCLGQTSSGLNETTLARLCYPGTFSSPDTTLQFWRPQYISYNIIATLSTLPPLILLLLLLLLHLLIEW